MMRAAESGEIWERIRSFIGRGRFEVAVIRSTSNGHIRNVSMDRYMSWPEVEG